MSSRPDCPNCGNAVALGCCFVGTEKSSNCDCASKKKGFFACGKEFDTESEAIEFERERRVGKWYDVLGKYQGKSEETFNRRKLAEHLADTHPYVYEW